VRRVAALAATLIALAAPSAALAQQCPQTSLSDVEDEVMCPRCERPLSTVDGREPQAQRERAFIETMIAQCKSKDDIKTALAAQFGDDVLALPDEEGFDLTAYIAPVLVPLLALAAIGLAAARWRRRRPEATATATGPGLDPSAAARLDEDLERYKL
jgi:cytochrome c-type biogenesis protein CcmH/NrfF